MTRAGAFLGTATIAVLVCADRAGFTACPFALLSGIPCPGCGLGRATLALVTGHPLDAFHFHPLVFVALPSLVALLAFPRARSGSFATGWAAALLVAVVVVWIARFEGAFGGPVAVRSIGE